MPSLSPFGVTGQPVCRVCDGTAAYAEPGYSGGQEYVCRCLNKSCAAYGQRWSVDLPRVNGTLVPCDKAHAWPPCQDEDCWRAGQ